MKYDYRYIAKFTIEAETPLSVGSGEKGLTTDRLVAKDANGLPYLPGTSIAGVLRHSFSNKKLVNDIFGKGGDDGTGSRLIISSALLVGEDGKTVIEGLRNIDKNHGYYSYFSRLAERDHVRMTGKGAADTKNHGKYDEELVHKGTRFVFEMELIGDENDGKNNWGEIIKTFVSPIFRIGAGTRKGFGKLKIIAEKSKKIEYHLSNKDHLNAYLNKSSSLNESIDRWNDVSTKEDAKGDTKIEGWTQYTLCIQPKDFFLFGAGFGDEDVDNKPKTEKYFEWNSGKPVLTQSDFMLIPATSIKGTIAHRVAYHYNKEKNIVIGETNEITLKTAFDKAKVLQEIEDEFDIANLDFDSKSNKWGDLESQIQSMNYSENTNWEEFSDNIREEASQKEEENLSVGENNEAVKALFGYSKNNDKKIEGLRGNIILSDVYLPYESKNDKVFNHTKIDRFTNGTIDGALFQEKAIQYENNFEIEIWVNKKAIQNKAIKEAFEKSLEDICNGNLQLGGNSSKGHGLFTGSLKQ